MVHTTKYRLAGVCPQAKLVGYMPSNLVQFDRPKEWTEKMSAARTKTSLSWEDNEQVGIALFDVAM